jgi:hypothetical protein
VRVILTKRLAGFSQLRFITWPGTDSESMGCDIRRFSRALPLGHLLAASSASDLALRCTVVIAGRGDSTRRVSVDADDTMLLLILRQTALCHTSTLSREFAVLFVEMMLSAGLDLQFDTGALCSSANAFATAATVRITSLETSISRDATFTRWNDLSFINSRSASNPHITAPGLPR